MMKVTLIQTGSNTSIGNGITYMIGTKDVSRTLKIPQQTVLQAAKRNKIGVKIDGQYRFDQTALFQLFCAIKIDFTKIQEEEIAFYIGQTLFRSCSTTR